MKGIILNLQLYKWSTENLHLSRKCSIIQKNIPINISPLIHPSFIILPTSQQEEISVESEKLNLNVQ